MPKLIDHDEKRREIAACAALAIADKGIDEVTMVDIGRAAACTTGCVTHYFDSKDQLLLAALRHVDRSMTNRAQAAFDRAEDLVPVLLAQIPATKAQRREWMVWQAFAARAAYRPELAKEFALHYDQWRRAAILLLKRAQKRRQLPKSLDPEIESDALIAYLDGLGSWVAVSPREWPRTRLEEQIKNYVDKLGGTRRHRSKSTGGRRASPSG